jgi:hypothetical protein
MAMAGRGWDFMGEVRGGNDGLVTKPRTIPAFTGGFNKTIKGGKWRIGKGDFFRNFSKGTGF